MKQALVTGGCGFLGSSIVRELLDRGVGVRILALPGERTTNVDGLEVEIVRGNVLDPEACRVAVAGCDTVFHAAAVYKSWAPDPSGMYAVNSRGTFNMLEACRRADVGTVIYTASIVSLGRPPKGSIGDETTNYDVWDLDFAYSRSKFHSRVIAEDFAAWGLDVRVVCPGVVFGPRDIAPTPSGKLIIEVAGGNQPPIWVDGGASYVDVRDAAAVHVLAAEKGAPGERYLATEHNLSNYELLTAITRTLDSKRRFVKVPTPVARGIITAMNEVALRTGKEPPLARAFFEYSLVPSYFDSRKSKSQLGATYRPIEESIRDAAAWFREHGML
ncbi:MAG: NAD-dependent epimerase/dehydratase family protein [Myxococcota bacterium]